jgi:hypothetical protein
VEAADQSRWLQYIFFYLELLGAWEPPNSSGPLPVCKGEVAQIDFFNQNQTVKSSSGNYQSSSWDLLCFCH